ncbi:MAG: hypothetical protein MUD14_24150 [Hydrococcus sp. Prado102]|nr:hypothetical protein [Hydrococcus sp. Prado102]
MPLFFKSLPTFNRNAIALRAGLRPKGTGYERQRLSILKRARCMSKTDTLR